MKNNFNFYRIGERYDPENDCRSQDLPPVTWAEKALYDAVKALALRVNKLETQFVPEEKLGEKMDYLTEQGLTHLTIFIQWLEENLDEDELTRLEMAAKYHIKQTNPCTETAVLNFFVAYRGQADD